MPDQLLAAAEIKNDLTATPLSPTASRDFVSSSVLRTEEISSATSENPRSFEQFLVSVSNCVARILFEPSQEPLVIESFQGEAVSGVELLGSDAPLSWTLESSGLQVTLPAERPYQLRLECPAIGHGVFARVGE